MFRLLLLIFLLPSISSASERTFGNGTLPEHLALYDADDSGGLSEEELQILRADRLQRQQLLRNRWDLNNDGKISDEEREAAKSTIRETIEARRIKRFTEVDRDQNGQLTFTEFLTITAVDLANRTTPGIAARIFASLDSDKNNTVSTREFLLKLDTLPPVTIVDSAPSPHPQTPLPASPERPR